MMIINTLNNYINKYKNLSVVVKASVWFTICNILQKGISTITVPIFTRLLTAEQYGVYSVYQSWNQIITVFATLNMYHGIFNNGMIKYEKDKDGFTVAVQGLCLFITFVLFLFYVFEYKFWNKVFDLSTVLMVAMFAELMTSPAFMFWAARERYEFRYKKLVVITLIMSILSPVLGIIGVIFTNKFKAEAKIIAFVLVQVVFGIYFFLYNRRSGKKLINKEYWKYAISFGIPLIPHYLSQSILNQSDRIMINSLVGTDKAAIYSVAYSIAMLMTLVTSAINNSFIPYTYKKIKEKQYLDIGKNANSIVIFVGICVMVVIGFGPEAIAFFAPKQYYEAIWIIPPVALSVYFMFLYPLFGNIEFYFEEKYYVTLASISGAILNIILNYIFIKRYGYLAAGYTTLFCYIIFSLGHYIFMKIVIEKHIPDTKIYDIKFIFNFSMVMLLGTFIMLLIYKKTIIRYTMIFMLILIILIKREYFFKSLKNNRKEFV